MRCMPPCVLLCSPRPPFASQKGEEWRFFCLLHPLHLRAGLQTLQRLAPDLPMWSLPVVTARPGFRQPETDTAQGTSNHAPSHERPG